MNFETVNNKQLQDMERLAKELLDAMRKAKFGNEPLYKDLAHFLEETMTERRARFDATDASYRGY